MVPARTVDQCMQGLWNTVTTLRDLTLCVEHGVLEHHALIAHFFLALNSILFFWLYHSIFIQSPTEGYLGCFQILAIVNKVAINSHAHKFSTPLSKYQGLQLIAGLYGYEYVCWNMVATLRDLSDSPSQGREELEPGDSRHPDWLGRLAVPQWKRRTLGAHPEVGGAGTGPSAG